MEMESCILVSVFSLIKAFYLDLEHCLSSIDLFLQNVPKFLWSSLEGKSRVSNNSFEAHHQGPFCNNKSFAVEKMNISGMINLVMSRLGMEDVGSEYKDFVEEELLTLFDEEEPSFEEIKETFEVFDSNKDGFIDCNELQRVLRGLGLREGCDLEDCKRMIQEFDVNGDGLIDFLEFVIFMEKVLLC